MVYIVLMELRGGRQEVGRAIISSSRHRNISEELGIEVVGRISEGVELVAVVNWVGDLNLELGLRSPHLRERKISQPG